MNKYLRIFGISQGIVVMALVLAVPIALAQKQLKSQKNFRVVTEGTFFRSGQMTLPGLHRMVHENGIRTVVTLRDSYNPGEPSPDQAEENWCKTQEIQYLRLTPMEWEPIKTGQEPPVTANIRKYLAVLNKPESYPVLVHCFAGIHRTGAYTAIYRMEKEGWPLDRAMEEMRLLGYDRIEEEKDILGFLKAYKPGALSPKK
jgi:protein tyrosine/serine phosphatase